MCTNIRTVKNPLKYSKIDRTYRLLKTINTAKINTTGKRISNVYNPLTEEGRTHTVTFCMMLVQFVLMSAC